MNTIKECHLLSAVYQFARAMPTIVCPNLIMNNNVEEEGMVIDNGNNNREGIEIHDDRFD